MRLPIEKICDQNRSKDQRILFYHKYREIKQESLFKKIKSKSKRLKKIASLPPGQRITFQNYLSENIKIVPIKKHQSPFLCNYCLAILIAFNWVFWVLKGGRKNCNVRGHVHPFKGGGGLPKKGFFRYSIKSCSRREKNIFFFVP